MPALLLVFIAFSVLWLIKKQNKNKLWMNVPIWVLQSGTAARTSAAWLLFQRIFKVFRQKSINGNNINTNTRLPTWSKHFSTPISILFPTPEPLRPKSYQIPSKVVPSSFQIRRLRQEQGPDLEQLNWHFFSFIPAPQKTYFCRLHFTSSWQPIASLSQTNRSNRSEKDR